MTSILFSILKGPFIIVAQVCKWPRVRLNTGLRIEEGLNVLVTSLPL